MSMTLLEEIDQLATELESLYPRIKALALPRRSFKPHQRTWEIGGEFKSKGASEVKRAAVEMRRLAMLMQQHQESKEP